MKSSKTEIGKFRVENLWRSNIKSFMTGNIILSVKKKQQFLNLVFIIFSLKNKLYFIV